MKPESANPITFPFSLIDGAPLQLCFYRAQQNRKNKTILYLHGGGLVYGSADDLPDEYLHLILEKGYDFATLQYPLSPEAKLNTIFEKILEGLEWFQENHQKKAQADTGDYILFGRSAGAYLALYAAHHMKIKPKALLLLYGYYSLQEASFRVPSRHYLAFPKLEEKVIRQLIQEKPLVDGPKETRFSLYIHYRQTGEWVKEMMPPNEKPSTYSLTLQDLQELPPAFISASLHDPDVPYSISKKMADNIPGSHLETIASNEHDFDRTTTQTLGKMTYQKMLAWLDQPHATKDGDNLSPSFFS